MGKRTALRRRRVAVITGTRAEYGLLRSTMEAIKDHPRLTLQVVVTGMHLLRRFGSTVRDIEKDGWRIDARVRMQRGNDGALDQSAGLARGVAGIAAYLHRANTDVVLVLGDRIEALAGALAAVTTDTFLAHIHGGDVAPGDMDEGIRHAITKLAHVHLAATHASARRIERMGETAERVHVVGAPGLDRLFMIAAKAGKRRTKPSGEALVLYHPIGRSAAAERRTMRTILKVVSNECAHTTVIYPNSDRGHSGVIAAIEAPRPSGLANGIRVTRSMPRDAFLAKLVNADVLVGNSSCGIIEAGAARTPTLNIGPRQDGRQRNGSSVVDSAEDEKSMRTALRRALCLHPITKTLTPYGDGRSGNRIANILAAVGMDKPFRRKCNRY